MAAQPWELWEINDDRYHGSRTEVRRLDRLTAGSPGEAGTVRTTCTAIKCDRIDLNQGNAAL